MSGARPKHGHRSWRNYLLDDRYQLHFTMLMVSACALVFTCLGLVAKREVRKATEIAVSQVETKVDEGLLDKETGRRTVEHLTARRRVVNYALVAIDLALVIGLFGYGIGATHRVAGPLHKISKHLDGLARGRFEPLGDLRKGDQLVGFFEQFRDAYQALRRRQEVDASRLRQLLAVAERAGLANRCSNVAARIEEAKTLLRTKEASLG